ncbi:hypothetical protein CFIMG_007721RA00001 [Ceratocystis fimbriata CBS 114723]|uniref:Rhomboid family membrane protein n=2 Tax=Ceratocystis TaxID=5157 RepID=A0A0F8DG31_CERFI|nr:hypothetical protein CFO_g2677 [Ceratocystis platani]PHH49592.1 hypothetical protein CFIMG_007721RA00001 [Ceratocystis fimbriata CBS 114723]
MANPNPTTNKTIFGEIQTDTPAWLHTSAIVLAAASGLAILLPPRRFDLRLLVLSSTFSLSTSQLAYDYTGKSIMERFGSRMEAMGALGTPELSDRSKEVKRLLREEKMRNMTDAQRAEEARKQREKDRSILQKLWLGDEGEDWKEKRMVEDRKALEEGKGISGIIMDQISDVFHGNDSKDKSEKDGGDKSD